MKTHRSSIITAYVNVLTAVDTLILLADLNSFSKYQGKEKDKSWSTAMCMEWVIFMCLWELGCFLSAWSKHKFSVPKNKRLRRAEICELCGDLAVYTLSSEVHIEGILDITVFSCLWIDWVTNTSRPSHYKSHCRNLSNFILSLMSHTLNSFLHFKCGYTWLFLQSGITGNLSLKRHT